MLMNISRRVHTSCRTLAKVVQTTVEQNVTTVEGIPKETKRQQLDLGEAASKGHSCSLCELKTRVRFTDVLIIDQFLDAHGKLMPREATGICQKQHLHMAGVLEQAKNAGLIGPPKEEQVFVAPHRWKKFNVYYEFPKRYTLLPNNNKI